MNNGFLDDLPDLGLDQYSWRKGRRRSIPAKPHFAKLRFVDCPAVREKLIVSLMNDEVWQEWQAAIKRVSKEVGDYDKKWTDDPGNPFPIEWFKNNLPHAIEQRGQFNFNKLSEQEYDLWRRIVKELTGFNVTQGSDKVLKIFKREQAKYWEGHRCLYLWTPNVSRLANDKGLICFIFGIYHDHFCGIAKKIVTDELRSVDQDVYEYLTSFIGQLKQAELETLFAYAKNGGLLKPAVQRKSVIRERQAADAEVKDDLSWQAKAIALLVDHRDWSIKKVAQEVGRSPKTLYSDREVSVAIKARSKQKKAQSTLPAGKKNAKTGELEAW